MTKHRTRGSSADRHVMCAGPIGYEGPRVDHTGPEAQLGTAAGEAAERLATGKPVDLDEIAHAYSVDRGQLGMAYSGAAKIWIQAGQWFLGAASQVRLDGVLTCGTADLLDVLGMPGTMALLDWKLGMLPNQHVAQLKAYACAAVDMHGFPDSGYVLGIEAHMMTGAYWIHRFTEPQLDLFREQLHRQHMLAGRQFAPGDGCKYCPLPECRERDQWLRSSATALVETVGGSLTTREALGAAYGQSKALKAMLRRYDKALKIAAADGPIATEGGVLTLVESETEVITPSVAIEWVDDADLDELCSVSKASIKRALSVKAGKGELDGMARDAIEDIRAAGGIAKKKTTKVELIK